MKHVLQFFREAWKHKGEVAAGAVIGSGLAVAVGFTLYAVFVFVGVFDQAVAQQ